MKKLFLVFSVAFSSFAFGQTTSDVHVTTKEEFAAAKLKATSPYDIKVYEIQVIKLVNEYRISKGLNALEYDTSLYKAAIMQSDYMAVNSKVTHYNSTDGMYSHVSRIQHFLGRSTKAAAECCTNSSLFINFIRNYNHAQFIFDAWKNSKPHNSILLDPAETKIAVSISRNGNAEYIYACLVVCD